MKLYKLALLLLAFSLTMSVSNVFAQDDDDDDDDMEEMDEEEWQRQMDELTARKNDLMNQLNSLNADVDALKKMKTSLKWPAEISARISISTQTKMKRSK